MAKLKCDKHKKRVMILNGSFLHRDTGQHCDSPAASISGETYTANGVSLFGLIRPPRSVK